MASPKTKRHRILTLFGNISYCERMVKVYFGRFVINSYVNMLHVALLSFEKKNLLPRGGKSLLWTFVINSLSSFFFGCAVLYSNFGLF